MLFSEMLSQARRSRIGLATDFASDLVLKRSMMPQLRPLYKHRVAVFKCTGVLLLT